MRLKKMLNKRRYIEKMRHTSPPVYRKKGRKSVRRFFGFSGVTTMPTQADVAFAKWLQVNDPFLFQVAKKRAEIQKGGSLAGMGFLTDINWGDLAKSAIETVKSVAPSLVQYKAQSKILKTQLKRAEQGLPPMDASQYAPTVNIAPEITPETEAAATRIATESLRGSLGQFGQMLPMIAIGGAAIYFMTRKKRR